MTGMPTLKPKALKSGDLVRIVSPASPLSPEKIQFFVQLLEAEGYRVETSPHCFDADHHLAGTDEVRAKDLMDAFDDPNVAAVICSRGGYGCARLFPHLDLDRIAASRKLFLGFSDITTLHLALNRRGLPTLHGPMPLTLSSPRSEWVYESLRRNLKGDPQPPAEAPKGQTLVGGVGEGEVTGGCLCLLTDSIGTANPLQCEGKIVIIEDVDENPHRIDAMLTHLLNEGSIARAAGILIGEMTRTDERVDAGIGGKPWREIVRERLAPLGVPTVIDFPFGHASDMMTLGMGVRASMNADAGTIEYLEAVCEG